MFIMKITSVTITLISLVEFVFCISITFGQSTDTLLVPAYPPGALNEVIHRDTLATGEQAHTVYVLQQNSEVDTIYYITEELRVKNLTIVGKNNPVTGFPPVIAPFINYDNSSPDNIAIAIDNGFINFKNLYLLGTRADGSQVTSQCVSTSDSCHLIMENCIFENFGSTGTPNILNTWNAIGSDIFVTNCLFRNNQSNIPQSPGMNWAGPGVFAIDTMIVRNSTFFVLGGIIEGSGSSMGYLEFDHNTIFMQTQSSPFAMRQMFNAKITNNIFYSVYSAGLDSMHAYGGPGISSIYTWKPGILMLDSLYSDLEGDPYFFTEADRNIEAVNNAYFWPQAIRDNFDTLNNDPKYQIVGGKIYAPVWATTRPGAEGILTDRDSWPGIDVYTNNDSIDPGFNPALVAAASDSMSRFVRHLWENGGDGEGSKPFVYLSDPNNMFTDVADNWAEIQNYPVPENLRYSNQVLTEAGTDGLALGDLNWFPEKMPTSVFTQKNITPPVEFYLSQNYPNPFNATTTIHYYLPEKSNVSLKVFDLLGREVTTLVEERKLAGKYSIIIDGSSLSSGIYFYQLKSANFVETKKMLLIK
jgi:hypothetical protein